MSTAKRDEIRTAAEGSLRAFARLVGPGRLYGDVHDEAMDWLASNDGTFDQLLLLPRGHLKSHLLAVWCAWWITKHPETTILYVSATEDLAIKQLSAIKDILQSDVHRRYWPSLIHPEESLRARWAMKDICVDDPIRKQLGVRDSTVAARGITSNTTGLHCDVLVLDDLVVPENAYTEEGRRQVAAGYSQFSSVLNPAGITMVCGTRYDGKDIYGGLLAATVEVFDESGHVVGERPMFQVFERVVETEGVFLWPREQHAKTKRWYGFDLQELAKIRAKYFSQGERAQYYAQYYNNPNAQGSEGLTSDKFQYFDPAHLKWQGGEWSINGKVLRIFCAGDLAYTVGAKSDFTAFAVIGLTADGFIYILELDQFQTVKYDRYYQSLQRLHDKWKFRACRIETNAGANLVVEYIKEQFRKDGRACAIEGKPSRHEKIERIAAILEPRYENRTIWHYRGGFMGIYEDQLTLPRPSHDDLKDAVSAAVEISKPPADRSAQRRVINIGSHPRFGGRIRGQAVGA